MDMYVYMYVYTRCVNVNGKIGILRRGISRNSRGAVNAIYSRVSLNHHAPCLFFARKIFETCIALRDSCLEKWKSPRGYVFFLVIAPRAQRSLDFFWRGRRRWLLFAIHVDQRGVWTFFIDYQRIMNIMNMFYLKISC